MKQVLSSLIVTCLLSGFACADTSLGKAPPELTGYGLALKDFKQLLELVDNKAKHPNKHSYVASLTLKTENLDPLMPGQVKKPSTIAFSIVGDIGRRPGSPLPRKTVPRPLRVEKKFGWIKIAVEQAGVRLTAKIFPRYVFLDSKAESVGLAGGLIKKAWASDALAKSLNLPLGQDRWRAALRPQIQRVLQVSFKILSR